MACLAAAGLTASRSAARRGDRHRLRQIPARHQTAAAESLLLLPRRAEAAGRPAARHGRRHGSRRRLGTSDHPWRFVKEPAHRPRHRLRQGAADAARTRRRGAFGGPNQGLERLDRRLRAGANGRTTGCRPAFALGLSAHQAAGCAHAAHERARLGPQPHRRLRRRRPPPSRRHAQSRGFAIAVAPAPVARPDRPAAHRRRTRRLRTRHGPRLVRTRGRPTARRSAARRTLGPSLDGRLALQ